MCFHIEILFVLNAIKYHFKGPYDKQNLTLVVISYEIYETHQGSFHKVFEWYIKRKKFIPYV